MVYHSATKKMEQNLKFIGIIPARMGSTRFPGKPLANLGGKTVIERVYTQVKLVLDDVVVATDSQEIIDAVEAFGGKAVMTGTHHRSGTDRCHEAYLNCNSDADVIINIQGDEPFIQPSQIREIMKCFKDASTQIATLVRPFNANRPISDLENPNSPKVVVGSNNHALYFSRSVIPYFRGAELEEWAKSHQYYTHIGMYAFRSNALKMVTSMSPGKLEKAESLEQLRWLENGLTITVGYSDCETVGIDTPEDLKRAETFLANLS